LKKISFKSKHPVENVDPKAKKILRNAANNKKNNTRRMHESFEEDHCTSDPTKRRMRK